MQYGPLVENDAEGLAETVIGGGAFNVHMLSWAAVMPNVPDGGLTLNDRVRRVTPIGAVCVTPSNQVRL